MKLRTFSATEAELIFYRRPDTGAPGQSRGLGDFLELEVVLTEKEASEDGAAVADELLF